MLPLIFHCTDSGMRAAIPRDMRNEGYVASRLQHVLQAAQQGEEAE